MGQINRENLWSGRPVWAIVNGKAELRYFGCWAGDNVGAMLYVTEEDALKNRPIAYYDAHPYYFESQLDIELLWLESVGERLACSLQALRDRIEVVKELTASTAAVTELLAICENGTNSPISCLDQKEDAEVAADIEGQWGPEAIIRLPDGRVDLSAYVRVDWGEEHAIEKAPNFAKWLRAHREANAD